MAAAVVARGTRTGGGEPRPYAIAVLAATLLLAACSQRLPPADATYSTRGEVVDVPRQAGGELQVHHESVPGFRDRQGKPSHMDSMTMPFAVARGVSLAGIAPGDKVALTFEVRWNGGPMLRVVALRELPPDTALDLGGITFEKVEPLGTTPAATPPPSPWPPSPAQATDGPSAPASAETI